MEEVKEGLKPKVTATGSYKYGWQQMWKYFLYFFLIMIIVGLIESPVSAIQNSEDKKGALMILLHFLIAIYGMLLLPVVKYGRDQLYLRGIRNEKVDISELFDGFKKNYLNIILANLLTFAIIGIGFVFLIVPGIILACRLAFVSYLVMDKNLDPVAAVEKSWAMTRGHGWKIFRMGLLAILVFILGLLCLVVGVFIAFIWIGAAFAAIYHAIDLEEQKSLNDVEAKEVF
ncbi:hypothetical protein [Maribacter sp. HTCC2170]|uniref:hypothetical protein n=1 Tax=Maribacter sp. (strain HTCC2170 / KCCM 42371) TaxID=313603 RepID=UPI00006B2270|nr:hypothetical protein [Maribacter sp. HTCC2170]EAR00352.1 hypothetical protein FB2170_13061 [Maribacter sp. HTCC2170]